MNPKIKTVYVEVKRSKNFQTYTVGMEAEVDECMNKDASVKELFARCRRLAEEQIKIDEPRKFEEPKKFFGEEACHIDAELY